MSSNDVSVVLVHGAWADGSCWAKVIVPFVSDGIKVIAAPLPLTRFRRRGFARSNDERVNGPVILVGHAYMREPSSRDGATTRSRHSSTWLLSPG